MIEGEDNDGEGPHEPKALQTKLTDLLDLISRIARLGPTRDTIDAPSGSLQIWSDQDYVYCQAPWGNAPAREADICIVDNRIFVRVAHDPDEPESDDRWDGPDPQWN